MSRSSRRAEAARMMAAAEKDFVHTAADRVGPLAQSAAERVGPLAEAAADVIGAAADKVSPIAHSAATRVGPIAHSAADRVGPLAQSAADRLVRWPPRLPTGSVRTPGRQLTGSLPWPTPQPTSSVRLRLPPSRAGAGHRRRSTPAVEAARDKVTGDLLPKLSVALSAVAASPLVEEASHRAEATLAAAKGELALPEKKPKGRWLKRFAIIGALGAVVVVVARRFLGSKDADWQAARPSAPYVPPTPPSTPAASEPATDTAAATGMAAEAGEDPQGGESAHLATAEANDAAVSDQPAEGGESEATEEDFAATEPAPVGLLNVTDSGDIDEIVVDEVVLSEPVPELPDGEPVNETPAVDETAPTEPASRWSGEGVYVGTEPPEGYVIKGNERSMKYHMPEAAGYGRTIAEVWFNSEEAAQQAGFVRAQR